MNDRLPYEEQLTQQWNDLPLPDENRAWEDMKRRLDKDDDDGIIPVWLRGCGLWGLLAVVLLGIGWWFIRPDKWWSKKQETEGITSTKPGSNKTNDSNTTFINPGSTIDPVKKVDEMRSDPDNKKAPEDSVIDVSSTAARKPGKPLQKNGQLISTAPLPARAKKNEKNDQSKKVKKEQAGTKQSISRKPTRQVDNYKADISTQPAAKNKDVSTVDVKNKPVTTKGDSIAITSVSSNKKDSIDKKTSPDSATKKMTEPAAKTNDQKKDSSKPKAISFSAGLGMHQLIPIDGQKFTPYNAAGRKGSLADYIPSVFGRIYKDGKWFLQIEFRYGAPSYANELLYSQQSHIDSIAGQHYTVTTSNRLKKTFYHQLPLSFNYFVMKDWSIGVGFVWNKFFSAVSEETIDSKNNLTQTDSVVSQKILANRNDSGSVFSKSYFQAIFETQYRWRRFSIGARYSFGLEPYIQFTLPGGPLQKERNSSLQVFIHYELWNSKARK